MLFRSVLVASIVVCANATVAFEPQSDRVDESRTNSNANDSKLTNKRQADDSPRRAMEKSFDRSSPAIGSRLPDISAFDADGNELNLRDLKGSYSVIVFGCLT